MQDKSKVIINENFNSYMQTIMLEYERNQDKVFKGLDSVGDFRMTGDYNNDIIAPVLSKGYPSCMKCGDYK